ncbi:hypothetical protein QFC24_002292 [Naganishia onofrii]|uniref:Uncharacterized protein n=1 Tax=Naganishia onofrii TaxID=1851511 RepID=A0ACC2XQU1_9TREE|nr:hypothetical protein QFC24_002292 [Naganishia onofrii]
MQKPPPLSPPFINLLPPSLLSPSEFPNTHHHPPGQHSTPPPPSPTPQAERESLLFYSNITGFYRKGHVSTLNLTHPNYPIWSPEPESNSKSGKGTPRGSNHGALTHLDEFWSHLLPASKHPSQHTPNSNTNTTTTDKQPLPHIPSLINSTARAFNHTLAAEKRGTTWDWGKVTSWEISMKERGVVVRDDQTGEEVVGVVVPGGGGGGGDTGGNELGGKKKEKEKQVVVAGGNDTYSEWSWVHVRLHLFLLFCPLHHHTT